ncbi:MAG TPA: PASTA domain-containing protein, partial [Chloroflexota bacterium]|nr:PASTA domain-containing protein [Chloroflexota bacterium]
NAPVDKTAPYSTVGVIKFGVWPYTPPTPTPVHVVSPRTSPTEKPVENGHSVVTSTLPVESPTRVASSAAVGAPRIAQPVVIPSLTGLPLVEAQQTLTKLGLVVSGVEYQTVAATPENRPLLAIPTGAVLSQSPRSGVTVSRGEKVTLTIRR